MTAAVSVTYWWCGGPSRDQTERSHRHEDISLPASAAVPAAGLGQNLSYRSEPQSHPAGVIANGRKSCLVSRHKFAAVRHLQRRQQQISSTVSPLHRTSCGTQTESKSQKNFYKCWAMHIFTFLNPACVSVQSKMRLCQKNWTHLSFNCSCNRVEGHSTQGVAILAFYFELQVARATKPPITMLLLAV